MPSALRNAVYSRSMHACTAGEDAIKHLLSRGTHREFGYGALATMLVVYFAGAVWAAGSAIASGLFVPMLLIGSCVGRIVGLIAVDIAAANGYGSQGCGAPSYSRQRPVQLWSGVEVEASCSPVVHGAPSWHASSACLTKVIAALCLLGSHVFH